MQCVVSQAVCVCVWCCVCCAVQGCQWTTLCQQQALGIPNHDWTPIALAFISGPAMNAVWTRVNLSMSFCNFIEQVFAVSSQDVIDAVAQLDSLRMRHTVDSLATKFRQLTARLPMDCSRPVLTA